MITRLRAGMILGWIAAILLLCGICGQPAVALPESAVLEKLAKVPVFVLVTPEGNPLVRSLEDEGGQSVTAVFMDGQEAERALGALQKSQEEAELKALSETLTVKPLPLSRIYQAAQASDDQPDALNFLFDPADPDLDQAKTLLQQQGRTAVLKGVPTFVVSFGPGKGYVPVTREALVEGAPEETVIPVFFGSADAQNLAEQVQAQSLEAVIDVVELDQIIQKMLVSDEPWLEQVEFVPTQQAIEFIQSQNTK